MKVSISSLGKFHIFDLARELSRRDVQTKLFTAYPNFKLRETRAYVKNIDTFPYIHTPYMALASRNLIPRGLLHPFERIDRASFDFYCSTRILQCDVFHGMSSSSLMTGKKAKEGGAIYICDRGSSHIQAQADLIRSEFDRWDLKFDGIDQSEICESIIKQEELEYAECTGIFVPSDFAKKSFIEYGINENKVHKIPYGVDLSSFYPDSPKSTDTFDILFVGAMSLRKGIPYLLQAFKKFKHPRKRLIFAGQTSPILLTHFGRMGLLADEIVHLGHLTTNDLRRVMSRSHALILPSIEDGFGLVISQAMACGCPVIASTNTGGPELIRNRENGFLVQPKNPDEIVDCLDLLASDNKFMARMSHEALQTPSSLGGWSSYTDLVLNKYSELLK